MSAPGWQDTRSARCAERCTPGAGGTCGNGLVATQHRARAQKRRSAVIPSRCFPAYLARIQRISRPQVKLSIALNVALETPCRK